MNAYCFKLSDETIEKYRKNPNAVSWLHWQYISYAYILSEDFIREFKDYVEWKVISLYQNLSKEFIIEFADKIDFDQLLYSGNISKEIKDYCKMFLN
jgi:hypothetical protein